ncbi:MAG: ABC transporter permease [Betaproteobacteria bacterium]|nr:ABC transporter permease [Betaproteobacteria bacterium]
MGLFLFKRLITLIATLVATSVVVFVVLEILPGNAAQVIMGPDAAPEAVQALAERLGLDQPAWQRYGQWIAGLLQGDLGLSYAYGSPVGELVLERFEVTLPLALMAMLLTSVGIAVPNFWFAILLILLFSVQLRWFSAGGFPGWEDGWWDALRALMLPALSLAVVQGAILARITRSAVLEVLREDFVRTARAKGVSQRAVLWRHVLRNAMVPVLTVMGLQFAELLAGTIVVENVFYLPGLGRLIFQSIANRDLIVVRNCVLLLAVIVVVVNFVVDVLYAVIDPRVKASDL